MGGYEDKEKMLLSKFESRAVNKVSFDFCPPCQEAELQTVSEIDL